MDGLENTEDAVMDQEETDTEESDGDIADMETDITVDMDGQAAEEDGTAENGDEMADGDTEDGNRAEHGETEETAMPYSLDNAYTDAQGNVFNYMLDDDGNAVITGITLSGQALEIPDSINGAAVAAVSGGANSCVVSNPETAIPSLYVDCGSIGAYSFSGLHIGTLTIGENVACFEESTEGSVSSHYWGQFAGTVIGTLHYNARNADLGHCYGVGLTNSLKGPFHEADIGVMDIGDMVERIPEALLYQASLHMDGGELDLHVPEIGANAFAGGGVSIGRLEIGREVSVFRESYYSSVSSHHWKQFAGADIGTLCLYAADLDMEHRAGKGLANDIYPPFEGAEIGMFEIGAEVTVIPEYLLYQASISMDELEIHAATVGAYAFASENISIGTLVIGKEVETFEEDYYSSVSSHYWSHFKGVTVGTLRLLAENLATGHTELEGLTNSIYPPFEGAEVGTLEIGESVTAIPEYLLYGAKMEMDELEIHVPKIGAYAFASENISIGTLTLGEEVAEFTEDYYSSVSSHYWRQFAGVTVGTLQLLAENLATVHTEGEGLTNSIYAPFEKADVGVLEIGGSVTAVPEYFLYNSFLTMDALEIHVPKIGAYAFAGSGISIGTLTIGREVAAFLEDYFSTVSSHYWNQFMEGRFGRVVYAADCAATENDVIAYGTFSTYIYGPFQKSEIGTLAIADNVERIPDYLFYNANMALDDLAVNVPVIGAQAFQGKGIAIKTLTIGERVEHLAAAKYGSSSYRYWQQFRDADIGMVNYNAVSAVLDGSGTGASYYYSPFYKTGIDALNLGNGVDAIPAFLFYEAILEQEELAIHARAVGSSAFYSSGISIGALTIGEEVEELSFVKSGSYYYFRQFGSMGIGTLIYEPEHAATGASCSAGPFHNTSVGNVSFGNKVAVIPNYLFYNAKIAFGDFTVNISTVGCYSFSGSDISFGNLTVGENVSSFLVNASNYSRAFYNSAVEGSLNYDAVDARLDTSASNAYGPFYDTAAGSLSVGETVRYLDRRLFRGSSFERCTVYAVAASEEHLGQTLTASYLPESKYLDIHHDSGFADYFTAKAEETDWMCRDFFTVTYGDKVFDEDSGEYMVEVMRECSVCGYTEGGIEDMDDSYEVRLSIPVEVPLFFSGSKKSYEGSARVYAYGRLGNAYEGVRLSVDSAAENFGLAETGGEKVDVSQYLTAGFSSGSEAVFTPAQVLGNGEAFSNGDTGKLYTDSLAVSVKGIAFLRSGTGDYAIPIPLRVEIF